MSFDNNQFVQLVEEHSRIIYKISGAYTKTSHDREDLISEILLQLWRTSSNFEGNCKVSTWVYRVALNTAMNFKRKQKNETLFTPTDFGNANQFRQIIEAEPSEELDILYQCINELDDLNKPIILLYLDGNSHDEIAEITGISKSNVGTRIGRIKEQLKKSVTSKM
jgi:RNA polymerase sigma factor (sigma-70 family)